jgi:hypothetical protein
LGLHLPTSAPASGDRAAANSPPSPPSTQQPPVARPSSSASASAAHPNPPQNRPSAQPRQSPVVATSNPADKDDVIRRQRDEIARLQAQVAQLATTQNPAPQANQPSTNPVQAGIGNVTRGTGAPVQQAAPHQPLFMDEAAAELARAQLIAKDTEDPPAKKAALPDIVPGFKASPLSLGKCVATFLLHLLHPTPSRIPWLLHSSPGAGGLPAVELDAR